MKRTYRTTVCGLLIVGLVFGVPAASACPFCLAPPQTWSEILADADVILVGEIIGRELFDQQIVTESSARTRFRIRAVVKTPSNNVCRMTPGPATLFALKASKSAQSSASTDQNPTMTAPAAPADMSAMTAFLEELRRRSRPAEMTCAGFQVDRFVTISEYVTGTPGDLFLLSGRRVQPLISENVGTFETPVTASQAPSATDQSDELPKSTATVENRWRLLDSQLPATLVQWDSPAVLNAHLLPYLLNAPSEQIPQSYRLAYYAPFLESSDPEIASDAWGEFARSQYDEVVAVRDRLSAEKLRAWIARPDMSPERLGLYGMMLGLCGNESDAAFLQQQIGEAGRQKSPRKEFRYGTEGLMGGLLRLTGESGLEYLESSRLMRRDVASEEQFAVVSALQYIWSYEPGRISPDRLRQSLRLLLDSPEMREIVITDLSRWQDWQSAPGLISRFDVIENDEGTRRAILRFMIALTRAANRQQNAPIRTVSQSEVLNSAASLSVKSDPVPAEVTEMATTFLERMRVEQPGLMQNAAREFGSSP